jgi:hypothetical protein
MIRKYAHINVIDETGIEAHKADLASANPELAENYTPKPVPAQPARQHKAQRKTGTYREIRTIRNRAGDGGQSYRWAYDVTYENGKRIKSKSIGRVE